MTAQIEGSVVTPCTGCAVRRGQHEPYEIHPDAGNLLETVTFLLRHGHSPAQVIRVLLDVYAEEPPADGHNTEQRRVLLATKRLLSMQQVDQLKGRLAISHPDVEFEIVCGFSAAVAL